MADLKPIGSEKLTGQEKLKRIMEIARFNEALPQNINETSRSEYNVALADGQSYEIVKERQGYIIKKVVTEGVTDYIEPMKNRKYYSSYSQAFKRLNLLAKEINRLNENEEGISLFGEQKKFVLKTPKPVEDAEPISAPPAEPPSVPAPALPPSPEAEVSAAEDSVELDTELPMGPEGDVEMDTEVDAEMDIEAPDAEKVTFKTIQKLTGKLTQKIRTLDNEQGMTSEDIKYVVNMVLSSVDLGNLTDEDKEDIMSKFEDVEAKDEMGGMEPSPEEDITSDTEVEDIQSDMDVPVEGEMEEKAMNGAIFDSIFGESKVDKVISKYFEVSKKEILENQKRNIQKNKINNISFRRQMSEVKKLVESKEQELASKKFLEENKEATIVGKTNKKNLVFENKGKQVKISPEGLLV